MDCWGLVGDGYVEGGHCGWEMGEGCGFEKY